MIIVSANDNLFESLAPKVRINIAQGGAHCRQVKRKLAQRLVPRLCLGTFSEVALPPTN